MGPSAHLDFTINLESCVVVGIFKLRLAPSAKILSTPMHADLLQRKRFECKDLLCQKTLNAYNFK